MPNTLNGSNLPSSGETKAPQVNGIGTQTKEISEVLITPERSVEIEIRKIFRDSFTSYREMEKLVIIMVRIMHFVRHMVMLKKCVKMKK